VKRRREVRWRWWNIATVAMFPVLLYVAVAFNVYRFKHPELTQTQVVLSFWDAMCWR